MVDLIDLGHVCRLEIDRRLGRGGGRYRKRWIDFERKRLIDLEEDAAENTGQTDRRECGQNGAKHLLLRVGLTEERHDGSPGEGEDGRQNGGSNRRAA